MAGQRWREPGGHLVRRRGRAAGFPLIRDAVVVGAGPAGATTALLLARAGASVLLMDRARFPRDKACSEYLSPATTEILERLGGGILDAVEGARSEERRVGKGCRCRRSPDHQEKEAT